MRVYVCTGGAPRRRHPSQVGDRKTVKGVEFVRVWRRCPFSGRVIATSRGKLRSGWVPLADAPEWQHRSSNAAFENRNNQ